MTRHDVGDAAYRPDRVSRGKRSLARGRPPERSARSGEEWIHRESATPDEDHRRQPRVAALVRLRHDLLHHDGGRHAAGSWSISGWPRTTQKPMVVPSRGGLPRRLTDNALHAGHASVAEGSRSWRIPWGCPQILPRALSKTHTALRPGSSGTWTTAASWLATSSKISKWSQPTRVRLWAGATGPELACPPVARGRASCGRRAPARRMAGLVAHRCGPEDPAASVCSRSPCDRDSADAPARAECSVARSRRLADRARLLRCRRRYLVSRSRTKKRTPDSRSSMARFLACWVPQAESGCAVAPAKGACAGPRDR